MKILVAVLSLLLVSPLFAQSPWRTWGTYEKKQVFAHSVYRKKNIVQMWLRIKEPDDTGVSRIAFDCAKAEIRQMQVLDKNGIYNAWDEFVPVKKNTFGSWLFDRACP